MGFYERVLRPAMFCLPAETAHNLGKRALSMEFLWRPQAERRRVTDPRLEIKVAGLRQTSPFGLTAGFDKDALALPGLPRLRQHHGGHDHAETKSRKPEAPPGPAAAGRRFGQLPGPALEGTGLRRAEPAPVPRVSSGGGASGHRECRRVHHR